MNVLVTGGAGYIGSHAVKRLLTDGHSVVVIDNLGRGHSEAIDALRPIAPNMLRFIEADIANVDVTRLVMLDENIESIIHFAALAYVGESATEPLRYHKNNTASAALLLEAVGGAPCVRRFVFSSTCATYGEPTSDQIPIAETCPQHPINPYGASKLHFERILWDFAHAQSLKKQPIAIAALRYFNVAGSDSEGLIGEHHEPETHLIPLVLEAAAGLRDNITIFGTDYDTPDGTCIRDYVHVEDLIDAHVTVLADLDPTKPEPDLRTYNLGIGNGVSVREIISAAERVTGKTIPVIEGERRPGDPPMLFADPSKIKRELNWAAKTTDLETIISTAWRWMQTHPQGYATKS